MAVIRVEKNQNYSVIANHHLRNMELSLKAKGLMTMMLSLPPEWDYSVAGLAAICKEGVTAIRAALKELEENQYLVRERKNSEKGYFVYEYTLYEIPISSRAENTHAVNEYADNTHTQNRTQLNKEKLSKDKLNTKELNTGIYIEQFEKILSENINNEELRQLYREYIEMRESIEAPITTRGLEMLINRCARLANFDFELQKALVEAAIINQWKNVYLPNEQDVQNNTTLANLRRRYER